MLEIKNVTKRYSANGVEVLALNNVSVTFPEKGMVFLVGKSGSGKSTLLNISGGLDMPDEGEVVLKGKSSKDFTQADFDSYRNTFIGFIFQEFNVLNEYSVEENISLALELQGKPNDKRKVEELLEKVDLKGFGKRKPNTLSGGQKQRVAIARALVKNPEIIMGDEPTGSLDSATGKQVFDTLKKLSEEKLVVIVSHDRDSAERYADRIIELKDGNIISDRTRKASAPSNGGVVFEENVLYVTPGVPLADKDVETMKAFISSSAQNKRISLKPVATVGVFSATDLKTVDEKTYNGNDIKFIKSRLPLRHAVRMGSAGLKVKPAKLIFTVFLAVVAFVIFGLFTTLLTFSKNAIITKAVIEDGYCGAIVSRRILVEEYSYKNRFAYIEEDVSKGKYRYNFADSDVEYFGSVYGENAIGIYTYNNYASGYYSLQKNTGNVTQYRLSLYYSENVDIKGFCNLQNKNLSDYGLTVVAGEYPTGENEIAISTYQFDLLEKGGFKPLKEYDGETHTEKSLSSYDDILGCYVSLAKFESSVDPVTAKIVGVIDCGAIPEKFDALKQANTDNVYNLNRQAINGLTGTEIKNLSDDFIDYYNNSLLGVYFVGDAFYSANKSFGSSGTVINHNYMVELASDGNNIVQNDGETDESYEERRAEAFNQYVMTSAEFEKIRSNVTMTGTYYVTDYDFENASDEVGAYQYIYIPLSSNVSTCLNKLLDRSDTTVNSIEYSLSYEFIEEASSAQEVVGEIMNIFLGAGIGLALFAALMLSNFIMASISSKEKDIGILRAIGARGGDIFKIFITEALIITLSCFVFAVFASLGVCALVSYLLIKANVVTLSLFIFTFPDALMMFAVAVISAFAATAFPVNKTVKKKPVEAIRCL